MVPEKFFFICKRGCTEKEKKAKPRSGLFYANHRKKLYILDIQKSEKQSFVNIGVKKFEINENGLKG